MGREFNTGRRYAAEFKHEVCQYYDHHTQEKTLTKYGISSSMLWKWRVSLGYRNKHVGYNTHTEKLKHTVTKRERRDFMMTRAENGKLQAQLVQMEQQISKLEKMMGQLQKDAELAQSIRNLFK
jgi:uncharacterized protein YlxW (UPF0749 family)